MKKGTDNRLSECNFHDYVGGNQTTYISVYQEAEREFIVTHNTDIKPASYFTGRETELQKLRQRIEEGRKSVLVSGMGGIGKTQICRKLFDEYNICNGKGQNGHFSHIGYIEYHGDLGSSLQKCLRYKKQENPEWNREAAWTELGHLASDGRLLLFVDNVDKPMYQDPGLKKLNQIPGAVVITSRHVFFSDEFETCEIGFLSTEQCMEIYEKIRFQGSAGKLKPEERQDLEYIIEDLISRHTITIQFLANLARTKTWPVKRLKDELEKKGFRLEFHKNGEPVNLQKSYEALYDLSRLSEAEQNILEAFSVFPYIFLEADVCNEWLLSDAGCSEDDDILMGLYQKGWLQFETEQESYALHPVFAQFIYEKCRPKQEKHSGLIFSCKESLEIPESGSPFVCQQYLPFAENIAKKLDMAEDRNQILFIDSIAHLLQYISEYKKAEKLYEKSLGIREKVLGEEHPDTAASYNNLAYVYERQGEYGKAQQLYEKSLGISEKVLGEEHPDTAASYNNLAGVYERQGEYGKAQQLYEKSLGISEKILGEEHPDTATGYNNLAYVYARQGEYGKAQQLYEKSLGISEKVLGEEHPDTAASYNNLAYVYEREGEYGKAQQLYEKSLGISEKVLGEEHPDTAASYNNLAYVYARQGEYGKARQLYEKSLGVSEKVLGEEHPDTASSYNNLAGVYASQGEYGKAQQLYEKSLGVREKVLGEEHPDTASSYNNLAGIYRKQAEYEIALSYYLNAFKVLVLRLGINHPHTQIVLDNMKIVFCEWDDEGDFNQWMEENM